MGRVSYYRSPDFLGLRPSTQSARRHILERFRQVYGSDPLRLLHRRHITAVIGAGERDKPEAANHLLKTLRIILGYAVTQGIIASNPAVGIKKILKAKATAITVGPRARSHSSSSVIRSAAGRGWRWPWALYTAQRKGDVLRMGWQHVTGDTIAVRQQ